MWGSAVQVCSGLLHAATPQDTTQAGTSLHGGLAQLARAPALQAGGQRFESVILHKFVRKRIDEVNPVLDPIEYPIRKAIFDILKPTNFKKSKSINNRNQLKVYQPTTMRYALS